jgi:hypothetical protein
MEWRSRVATAWAKYRRALWPAATTLLAIAFIAFVVRPFQKPISQLDERDVSESWYASVIRLGILPLYPPEEDFHVGDVWAVLTDSSGTRGTPLLGEGMRIDHFDLREHIGKPKDAPSFDDTPGVTPDGYRHLNPVEKTNDNENVCPSTPAQNQERCRASITLAAFPGVTIRHSVRANAAVGGWLAALTGSRDDLETEELEIPIVETYGVPALAAWSKLDEYCDDPHTKIKCTDAFVRKAFAFGVNQLVLDTVGTSDHGEQYKYRLQLRLVYRVFLAREIEQRRYRGGLRSAGTRTAAPGTSETTSVAESATVGFKQVFQRPVVFGYRAVSIELTPSEPGEELR